MIPPTREEAQHLLNGPPSYDDTPPTEQFEIDDQPEIEDLDSSLAGDGNPLLQTVRRLSKNSIQLPVKHIIDPIVNFFQTCSLKFDRIVSRIANPFIVRRLIFVVMLAALIGTFYFTFIIKLPPKEGHLDHERLRQNIFMSINRLRLQENSEYFGQMPHVAGSLADHATAEYIEQYFLSLGMKSGINRHDIYLSHGDSNLLELHDSSGNLVYSSNLQEPDMMRLNSTQPKTQMPLVTPGEANANLVYANFGSHEDFKFAGSVKNRIVLLKFSSTTDFGMSCGEVALRAQGLGAAGVLFMSKKHPTEPSWPDGADFNDESIEQESIGSALRFPGDLLSPGWPSNMEQVIDRQHAYTASIPIAAISWNDAKPLLNSLKGSGKRVPSDWENFGSPQIDEWWTGPSSDLVHLKTSPISEDRHQITNVFGEIKGRELRNRVLFIGTRLDATCYGASQLSGLSVLLEIARAMAELEYSQQWTPLRSIHFVVWDGTNHNFAGSTEWVESVASSLQLEGIAYIDLDAGISGGDFLVQGNPVIDVENILKMVQVGDNKSLEDLLDLSTSYKPIPGYGNHIAFEAHTGVPTIKVGFYNRSRPVPLNSCLDNLKWMQKYGDPNYMRHFHLAEFVSYLALELSDAPILPFKYDKLVSRLRQYTNFIRDWAHKVFPNNVGEVNSAVSKMHDSINLVESPAQECTNMQYKWDEFATLNKDPSTGTVTEPLQVERLRFYWNEKLIQANSMALDINGISMKRNWYKNHMFGPSAEMQEGDALSGVFPGVQDAIHQNDINLFESSMNDAATHVLNIGLYLDEFGY